MSRALRSENLGLWDGLAHFAAFPLTDQLFIKANRIRTIQESQQAMVDEGIDSEFIGIVNYSLMAMIQCGLPEGIPWNCQPRGG